MFKQIIEECFADLKAESPAKCKRIFGYIWAVFASKRVRLNDEIIWMTWRDLSAELAIIYNEWFKSRFTTDAFLKVQSPELPIGADEMYDEVLMQVYRHTNCVGIFKVKSGPSIRVQDKVGVFTEIDVITGEEHFYKQGYAKGHRVGNPERISATEYESVCHSSR
jgi:hypothetical protein